MTKIDIISGFLGAGKTTLINKLIREAYGDEKLVLIENEFGEIGIDGAFLQDAGVNITEMNSGCICCSLVGDFSKALSQVVEEYYPDRVLIEPSGVGKLSDVIRAVQSADLHDVELNSFTVVVDVNKCKMYMKNFGEFFNDQIENAGCIVFSHTDNTTEQKLAQAVALVREHNGFATMITTPVAEFNGTELLHTMERKNAMEEELKHLMEQTEEEICPVCGHHHEHEHHHHHDHDHDEHCDCHEHHHKHHHHHHADEVFTSWGRETVSKFDAERITAILTALQNEEKYGFVLRAKGIVAGEDGKWIHFDYVPGEPDVRFGGASVIGKICVIGSKLQEDAIATLFGV